MKGLLLANSEPIIRLSPDDAQAAWGAPMLAAARRALERAQQRLGLTLNSEVTISSFASSWEFERYLRARPMHVIAVALPGRSEIVIHRPSWFSADTFRQQRVLVHEMTHLILGRRVKGPLPTWLDEGMAMVTAEESDFEYAWQLNVAGALGGLLSVEDLSESAPFRGPDQERAYAESLYLTRFYLRFALLDRKVAENDPGPLARALADPETGPTLLRRLWDPFFQRSLDQSWRRSQQTVWTWIAFLSGASFLWLIITGLFLLAYWRKRRMAAQMRERFADEEHRDAEFGTEPPPWEYGAGEDEGDEDEEEEKF